MVWFHLLCRWVETYVDTPSVGFDHLRFAESIKLTAAVPCRRFAGVHTNDTNGVEQTSKGYRTARTACDIVTTIGEAFVPSNTELNWAFWGRNLAASLTGAVEQFAVHWNISGIRRLCRIREQSAVCFSSTRNKFIRGDVIAGTRLPQGIFDFFKAKEMQKWFILCANMPWTLRWPLAIGLST